MSLISIRNFAAPIRNKFQIGAILIGGLLVAAIRAGLGTSEDSAERRLDRSYPAQSSGSGAAAARRMERDERLPANTDSDDLLKGLLDSVPSSTSDEEAAGSERKPSALDDIRGKLGIE